MSISFFTRTLDRCLHKRSRRRMTPFWLFGVGHLSFTLINMLTMISKPVYERWVTRPCTGSSTARRQSLWWVAAHRRRGSTALL